jgi:hypothetical protein
LFGLDTWKQIAKQQHQQQHGNSKYPTSHTLPSPCHVMVTSDEGTVCAPDSITSMKYIMAELRIHHYPTASHTTHNNAHEEFIKYLTSIIHHPDSAF